MNTTTAPKLGCLLKPGDRLCINRPRVWGEWHFYRKRYLVHAPNGKPSEAMYTVDLWSINNHFSLVDWLFHVGGKGYGTKGQTGDVGFYDAMHDIFRKAGWNEEFIGKELCLDYWNQSR